MAFQSRNRDIRVVNWERWAARWPDTNMFQSRNRDIRVVNFYAFNHQAIPQVTAFQSRNRDNRVVNLAAC